MNLDLDVDFMTLNILKLVYILFYLFLKIFLEFVINLRALLQKVVEKHQFYFILSLFK